MRQPILLCVIFLIFIFGETRLSGGPKGINALTDAQRKEIETLRAQLEEAFEKDEEKTLKAHGVITQPEWTQNSHTPHITKSKVVVTKSSLNEAKTLRDEINKAVKQDKYVPIVGNGQMGGNTEIIQELHKKYVANENNRKSASNDMVTLKAATNGPNVVEASSEPDIDIRKLQNLELSKRRTRERLILESIEEDFSFTLGKNIQEWEHIIHAGHEFFIGRLDQELLIVHKNALNYEASEKIHIGTPITYLETYTFWNPEQRQQEGIIIVATGDQVLWYRANEKLTRIALYWDWVVGSKISGLTYFAADGMDYLVVSSNQSLRAGYYALNIYQFDLKNKEFWITQRLQLAHPCGEVTFLNTGRDYILAIPQNNTAVIYTFNPHTAATSHVHFQFKRTIESEEIQYITAFQMGGRSYLALGGRQPQILLYQQGEFVPKTIFGNNFGLVEFFFPIPVRTYRDDLILLVQHRVDFSTHTLTVLETLIWDGEAFEATIPAPCKLGVNTFYGVNCMLDIQRDAGLKGAALLRRDDDIFVIVPRHEAESGLFRLHTKLLPKNSELQDLQDIFDFLKEWVAEQDALVAQAQSFLNQPAEDVLYDKPNFEKIQLLKTPELFFNGQLRELYVNDYKWTNADSAMDLNHVLDEIEQLEHELSFVRHKRSTNEFSGHSVTFENLDFDDVEAEFLDIESLNNEDFYIKNGELNFEGVLNLAELEVLESEHISEGRQTMLDELTIESDLEFEKINGIQWRDIEDNLVFHNRPLELENLEVEGDVIIENQLKINTLNSLTFPEDYLCTEGVQNQIINAKKTFTGTLAADHVDTEGSINDKDPLDIITLSDPQDWKGTPTFAHLEVSEIWELNGTARGRDIEDFPKNPTLEESNFITANCYFTNLRVLGPIILKGKFNNDSLENIVSDVIQRPEDPTEGIRIPSEKTFSHVEFPIDFHILDDNISNIPVDLFVSRQSSQELNLTTLNGYVYFQNLTLTGRYDGVIIDEFIRNTIRIDMPQKLTNTQLNFVGLLQGDTINIANTLNAVPIATGFQTVTEDLITPKVYFRSLRTQQANIPGDIKGTAKLNGVDLESLLKTRNSSEATEKSQNIYVNELTLEQGLQVDEIHGFKAELLFKFLGSIDSLAEMVLDGKVHLDRVSVSGDVQVNKLNGQHFDDDIQLMAIWLTRPNYLSTTLQFIEMVDLRGSLHVLGDYNNESLPDLIDDMVFRNDNGTVLILAPKKFAGYVQVLGNTKVDAVNGVPFHQYANKRDPLVLEGSMQINGNLIVQELLINGTLNDFPVTELSNQVRFDPNLQAFVLKGVTNFKRPLQLEDLTVFGDLNQFKNLKDFFENLVYKSGNCYLNGRYNFTGRVSIQNGAYVAHLNGHNLLDLFNNIAYINNPKPLVMDSSINFASPIKATAMHIKGSLQTKNVNGCSVKGWLDDTVSVEDSEILIKSLRFATGSLNGNRVYASFLNDVDLSKVITLNTPQTLSGGLRFSEVYLNGAINVAGPINGVDLQAEFENTLLTSGNQHIQTPLIMHTVNVLQSLQTNEPINGDKHLDEVATLHEDTVLESPFFFEELRASNVFTEDLISGIDFNEWYKFSLWKKGRPLHRITGNWSIGNLSIKNGSNMTPFLVGSTHRISGERSFQELCQKLKELRAKYSKRPYVLKYLEKSFELNLNTTQGSTGTQKAFKIQNYLLVNSGCSTNIFKWNAFDKNFTLIVGFESGGVDQLAIAHDYAMDSQSVKFITNSDQQKSENCAFFGLNLWELRGDSVVNIKSFNENVTEILATDLKGFILAITDGGLKNISTAIPYATKHLDIESSFEADNYSFSGQNLNLKMLYGNGASIAQISTEQQLKQRQRRATSTPSDIFATTTPSIHPLAIPDESMLKPNTTAVHKLAFADFSHIIERILEDLDYRLGFQVNSTQLGIPELDLYDLHLKEDFIAIIEELRTQQIYPANTFMDIEVESIRIPENPAHVLAARTVQIVWPVVVEIYEIHKYLRGNSTTEHPVCACILNYLGVAIEEVLMLAYAPTGPDDEVLSDNAARLSAVINRTRQFQKQLKTLEIELKLEIAEDLNAEIDMPKAWNTTRQFMTEQENDSYINSLRSEKVARQFSHERSELDNLEVGPEFSCFNLLAVTRVQSQQTPGQSGGIYLYTDILKNELFQFIPAFKPHSMAALRIRDITLLAYVEHCCTVHVLQYRGVEGFVSFAKFTLQVPIKHILAVSLPHVDYGQRHYFAAVLSDKLIFYEAAFTGLRDVPSIDGLHCG